MGKYISNFETTAEFEAAESTLATPHVSLTKDNMQVHYKPLVTPVVSPSYEDLTNGSYLLTEEVASQSGLIVYLNSSNHKICPINPPRTMGRYYRVNNNQVELYSYGQNWPGAAIAEYLNDIYDVDTFIFDESLSVEDRLTKIPPTISVS